MKKYLIFIILLLFPIMVSALDYRLSSHIDIGSVFFENSNISLYVDDNYTYNFNFYLDGELIVDEFIEEETPYIDYRLFVYNNTKRIFLKNMDYETRIQDKIINFTIYFETVPSDVKIHCFVPDTIPINQVGVNDDRFDPQFCDDYLEEGNYYSSKDILYLYDYDATANFYIEDDSDSYYHDTLARYFPDLEDDTYWVYTVSDDIGYQGYLSPIFEAYVPPKFEFKCEPKTIKQGETSKCTLYGISSLDLIRVNFDVVSTAIVITIAAAIAVSAVIVVRIIIFIGIVCDRAVIVVIISILGIIFSFRNFRIAIVIADGYSLGRNHLFLAFYIICIIVNLCGIKTCIARC